MDKALDSRLQASVKIKILPSAAQNYIPEKYLNTIQHASGADDTHYYFETDDGDWSVEKEYAQIVEEGYKPHAG